MPDKTETGSSRKYCYRCFRPAGNCLCQATRSFSTRIEFVFLLHSKEARKEKTGTGRLAHLCLQNSSLFLGTDFTNNQEINQLLHDPRYYPVLLFPGENAVDITATKPIPPPGKKLRIFVPDGTWTLVKRMINKSTNLKKLPQFRFTPSLRSQFVLKKEPDDSCVSTIEAVYYFLEEAQKQGWENCAGKHRVLMNVLTKLVDFQINCARENHSSGRNYD